MARSENRGAPDNLLSFPGTHPGHLLKVQLNGVRPPIWRRFEVPSGITLGELHSIIQDVMGWMDCHLHSFEIKGKTYGNPDFEDEFEDVDERSVMVDALFSRKGQKGKYIYDYGDDWVHTLIYEGRTEHSVPRPKVIKGRRACPPEDCGGIWGYETFLEAIGDPEHPEHQDMLEWVGETFDPEAFDLEEINTLLEG